MDETRALLDALMGPNRNQAPASNSSSKVPEFCDKNICKYFLVGFCPHDWFSMPKRQLTPCTKIHSELMKEKFESHPEVDKYRAWFEEDFLHHLQPIVRDCDNYIARERMKCRPKNASGNPRMPPDVQIKYDDLERRHGDLVRQSEEAADNASLGLSKELMGQALVMQEDIDTLKAKYTTEFQGEDICEVCGVRYPLGSGGAEWHDKESHKKGKTHQGFATIRKKVDELISKRREWDKFRSQRQSEYEPMLAKEQEQVRPRDRERDDGRGRRDRDRRDKDRDDRERSRGRTRPKEGDRRDRHRERSRKADRSNERSRSRRRRETARSRSVSRPARRHKDRDASSSRGRREKEPRGKEKDKKRERKGKSEEPAPPPTPPTEQPPPPPPPKRAPSSGRRSPVYSQDAPPPARPAETSKQAAAESSDEAEQPEDEKDGITVLEEDLPEFWARIQKLKGNVRNEAVAALSTGTKGRLELWLVSRARKRVAAPPAAAKVGA